MSPRLPPRREPRSLALVRFPKGLHYAAADPWELRSVGSVVCRDRAIAAAVTRLVRREKPTVVVTRSSEVRRALRLLAPPTAPAVEKGRLPIPSQSVAVDLYPEIRMRAPTPELFRTASLAISGVLFSHVPPRRYAPRRHRPAEHST